MEISQKALLDQKDMPSGSMTLQYLEGIAGVRFALSVVSELIYNQQEGKGRGQYTTASQQLLNKAKQCCENPILNKEDGGPGIFLVKLLARQHGMAFIKKFSSSRGLEWIVPDHLRSTDEVCIHNGSNSPEDS